MTSPALPSIDEIAETFALLDDWEDRYRYLVDLGRRLPELPQAFKTEATRVAGCQSQVWLVAEAAGTGPDRRVVFRAESDAHIVRGLVAVLLALYSGRTSEAIVATDSRAVMAHLGLDQHLSPSRSNGLAAMDRRMKELAVLLQ